MAYLKSSPEMGRLSTHIQVENGGLFISTGDTSHPQRRLSSFELILVRDGRLNLKEEASSLTACEGEILILHPGRSHRGIGRFPKDLVFYWLHFRIPAPLACKLNLPTHHIPARKERVAELFHWFLDDQKNGRLTELRARYLVLLILEELTAVPETRNRSDSRLAIQIEEAIASSFSHRLRLRDISTRLGFSGDYLDHVFKKARGLTITQFIREQRIKEARWMLLKTNLQMKEIAERCGYANAAHFTRSFREATGILPNQFRNLNPDLHINVH